MYCNKCGKPMQPHYTGICPTCSYREYVKNTSFAEFSDNLKKAQRVQKKKDNKTLAIVIIAGFFCPLIWIVYFLYKNWGSVEKWAMNSSSSSYSGSSSSYSGGGSSGSSSSSFDDSSSEKKFVFTGGDGNIYESGGLFCDWAGNHLEWGSPFRDSRGNLVSWGSPFYDNRDNYTTWGSPFYDAGDNYINPRG